MTAAATTAAAAGVAAAAALLPPPTGSPSQHPEGASGAAEAQIREPQHPGAVASVRACSLCCYIGNRTEGASLNPSLQSPNPRSANMTFRGSYFILPKSNEFSIGSD